MAIPNSGYEEIPLDRRATREFHHALLLRGFRQYGIVVIQSSEVSFQIPAPDELLILSQKERGTPLV